MGFLLFATEITGVGPRGSLLQDHPAGFGLEFHMDLPVVWLATSNHEIHVLNPWFPWEIAAISMDFPWISLPGSVVLSFPTQFQGIRGRSHGSKGNHQTCLFRSLDHEDLAISRRKMAILGKNMEKKNTETRGSSRRLGFERNDVRIKRHWLDIRIPGEPRLLDIWIWFQQTLHVLLRSTTTWRYLEVI